MTDLRNRLRGLGVSEERLSALNLGAPKATTAPAVTTEPVSIFRARYSEHQAQANAPKSRPVVDAKSAADCVELFRRYRDGNFAERAFIRLHREAELETGRRLFVEPNDPPEPEAA